MNIRILRVLAACVLLPLAGCAGAPGDAAAPAAPSTVNVTLTAEDKAVEIDGKTLQARVFNGAFAAPTIRVRPGDSLDVELVNQLDAPANLHFHGMHVSPQGDSDNIFRQTPPGATEHYSLQIPPDHEPGLYWYHSHIHGMSEGQVFGGLSGMLVVEGLTDLLPDPIQGATEQYLALRDFQVQDGAIPADNIDSGAPTTRVVNGEVDPRMTIAPGETQVWHVANIGADIWYDVELTGHRMWVIAEDADPVWEVWEAEHLVMPPGKRYEVLVQGAAPGTYELRTRAYNQGTTGDQYPEARLATLVSEGAAVERAELPTSLIPERDLRTEPVARERRIVFTE
ncbi:MAG: multicopper oxidase family protein, partial [Pseudonocardia sp.]